MPPQRGWKNANGMGAVVSSAMYSSGVSTAYEPLRSRRRPPRHIKTTTTPGVMGDDRGGRWSSQWWVREHSRLEEYARGG